MIAKYKLLFEDKHGRALTEVIQEATSLKDAIEQSDQKMPAYSWDMELIEAKKIEDIEH